MKYSLCFLAIIFIFLPSCKDKLIIGEDQSRSFIKFYGNAWEDNAYDIKTIPISASFPNGGYAIAGYTSNTTSDKLQGDKDILFVILDRYGNIVGKEKKFGGAADDIARRLYILPGGAGFLLAGYTTISGQKHAYIIKLNSAGTDTAWTWTSNVPGSANEEALSLHVDSISNIYTVTGYQTISDKQNGWIFDLQDFGDHLNYDSNSSALTPIYSIPNTNNADLNVQFADICFLTAPYIGLFGSFASPASLGNAEISMSVAFVGKKQGSYNVFNSDGGIAVKRNLNEYPKQMLLLPGDSAVYMSSLQSSAGSPNFKIHLSILKDPVTPSASDSIAQNWYFADPSGSLDAAKMNYNAADNTFAIVGTLTSTAGTSIVLLKIDASDGTEMWRRTYGINDSYKASGLDQAPDGGYIISGSNNTGGYNQSLLIIKTNADGFLE